ncbi:tetratricopeptide repeat protein [Haloferula chungangensis]|uniref:Tetratricopeptide repeat protein n=1 Tax=Haloferula chungangensis TaxID=1048331 RepID=A0ABW2L8D5_9BACT
MKPSIVAAIGIPLCLLVSCKDESAATKRPSSAAADSSANSTTAAAPISDDDQAAAIAFGKKFEEAVESQDEDYLRKIFDFERIIEDSFAGIELPADFRKGMRHGMQQGRDNAIQNLFASKVHLVEYRSVKGKPGLLFRFRIDGGMDYVEYQISKSGKKDPEWVISDAYTHSMGSFVSDLLRAMVLPVLAESDRSLVEKILSGNPKSAYIENVPKISQMMQLGRNGDPESGKQALEIWKTIPTEVRKAKFAMVAHIFAQSCLLEDIESAGPYLQAIDELEQAYPGDPALALMSIDQNIIRKDYDGARNAIRTLRKSIPDPYLDFYLGYVDLHAEDYESAETRARTFIEIEPEDSEGYEMLLESGFGADQHEVTAEALTKLEADFDMDFSGALTAEGFESFIASEPGKKWIAQRGLSKRSQ